MRLFIHQSMILKKTQDRFLNILVHGPVLVRNQSSLTFELYPSRDH